MVIIISLGFLGWLWLVGGRVLSNQTSVATPNESGLESLTKWQQTIQDDPNLTDLEKRLNSLVYQASLKKGALLADPNIKNPDYVPSHRYRLNNLVIIDTKDREFLKNYGQLLALILKFYEGMPEINPMKVTLDALENETGNSLDKIRIWRNRHATVTRELATIPTPKIVAEYHLQLINSILNLAESNFHMENVLTEPILALEHVSSYPARTIAFNWALTELNKFFRDNEVNFDTTDTIMIPSQF